MPNLEMANGTIYVGSKFAENMGAKALLSAPLNIGNNTSSMPVPNAAPVGVRQPAFAGQWYPVPDDWVNARRTAMGLGLAHYRIFGRFYNGTTVEFKDSEVQYTTIGRKFGNNEGTWEVKGCSVKLTSNTAAFLLDGGLITQRDFDRIVKQETNTQEPTITGAISSVSKALIVVSVVAAAIYFLPRFH